MDVGRNYGTPPAKNYSYIPVFTQSTVIHQLTNEVFIITD